MHSDCGLLNDMLGVFPDVSGHVSHPGSCGKHLYNRDNWTSVIKYDADYYPAEADRELVRNALQDIGDWGVPQHTAYVDLGVGGITSFERYALPIMQQLHSKHYIGVDYCDQVLKDLQTLRPANLAGLHIDTVKLDLFCASNQFIASKKRALGVMNGLTIGNIGDVGSIRHLKISLNDVLRQLSQLCGHGWLLITTDTNQDEASLRRAYNTAGVQNLFRWLMTRVDQELPVKNYQPGLFGYESIFNRQLQRMEHRAIATQAMDFTLGGRPIHLERGQPVHLCSSYKYRRDLFEECCHRAGLSSVREWTHETGVVLYLLKDINSSPSFKHDSLNYVT